MQNYQPTRDVQRCLFNFNGGTGIPKSVMKEGRRRKARFLPCIGRRIKSTKARKILEILLYLIFKINSLERKRFQEYLKLDKNPVT